MDLTAESGSRIEVWYEGLYDAFVRHDAIYATVDGERLFEIGLPSTDFHAHMREVVRPICYQVEAGCFSLHSEPRKPSAAAEEILFFAVVGQV